MASFEIASESGQPIIGEIRDKLVDPLIAATTTAVGEMASTAVVVCSIHQTTTYQSLGDMAAIVVLRATTDGFLVLNFPTRTAAALAGRILAGSTEQVDVNLTKDCVGEIANVVAGQAKALLAETPFRFAFSMPKVVVGPEEFQPQPGLDCLVVTFDSDLGEFTMQVLLKL